jgi:metal-dependent amidase/aminoacylase/carboxypeptidase family protein
VSIETGYPITYNDPKLTEQIAPTFRRLTNNVEVVNAVLGAEDFSFYQEKVPGVFFWLGTRPKNKTAEEAASNHSPLFYVDESGLLLGVRAMSHVAVDYLNLKMR